MKAVYLQKTTLIDFPGKVAATLFTHGCNFRCPFCHNPELVTEALNEEQVLDEDELLAFLKTRVGLLDALAVTGGEPLIHKDLLHTHISPVFPPQRCAQVSEGDVLPDTYLQRQKDRRDNLRYIS